MSAEALTPQQRRAAAARRLAEVLASLDREKRSTRDHSAAFAATVATDRARHESPSGASVAVALALAAALAPPAGAADGPADGHGAA